MDTEKIKEYKQNPVSFIEEILGTKLHWYQKIMLESNFKLRDKLKRNSFDLSDGVKMVFDRRGVPHLICKNENGDWQHINQGDEI